MPLQGTVAVITGAGSGIGRQAARLFANRGADVVAVDIDGTGATETAEPIADDDAEGAAVAVEADVTDASAVDDVVAEALERFGGLDVLYNNAGIAQETTPIDEIDQSVWRRQLDVHLTGPFLGIQAAVPHMREAGGGVILNTASVSGLRPRDGLAAYTTAKGGLITLTKQAAIELAEDGIRVNALCPVAADTPMLTAFVGDVDRSLVEDAVTETIPLGRLATPDDVARAAAFLASDEAGMLTGVVLPVDGGRAI